MARPLRIDFPGAVYHVIARGHERGAIFRENEDFERWVEALGGMAAEEGWEVHAYCAVSNQFHLLLETPRGNLSRGMRSLNGRYAQGFNRRHRRRGHLFEGRFKAVLVQKSSHLLELCRYVVLNPVRAHLARSAAGWRWSNYRATAGEIAAPPWLEVDWTLAQFSRSRSAARRAYRRFVSEGKGAPSPLSGVRGQIYLGDDEFLDEMARRARDFSVTDQIPARQLRPNAPTFDAIRSAVAREWRVAPESLSRRRGGEEKMAAIYAARKLSGRLGREIAEEFGVKPARVSNVVREIQEGSRGRLKGRVDALIGRLGKKPNAGR